MIALVRLAQAAVYGAAAYELSRRWQVDAVLIGAAGVLQLVGLARRPRLEPWLQLGTVAAVLIVYGRFAAVALHVERVFGPLTGQQMMNLLGGSAGALPWVLAFPLVRLWMNPPRSRAALVLLPLALTPALDGLRPYAARPGADQVEAVAGGLWASWHDGTPSPVALDPDALVRISVLRDGVASNTLTVRGEQYATALAATRPPGEDDALLVDIAEQDNPLNLLRPGVDAPAAADARSPLVAARSFRREELLPGFSVPSARDATVRWRSAVVSPAGVTLLDRGWAPGPATVDCAAIDAAVIAGAAHLAHNMREDGRFTYIVKGPSGESGAGYNYPRHAGTAWFLTRVWAATGDTTARDAADAAIAHLDATSGRTDDGRAYVLDPDRSDGRAWIGTTALAALALTVRGTEPELLDGYVRQLAASVDSAGKVRGEMETRNGKFPEQAANAYGQGQAVLALAAAERVGLTEGSPALDRAVRYYESGDYVGSAHPVTIGDEHWTCLAARAIREVRNIDAGSGICDAYVANERFGAPADGGGLTPAAGPGGAAAEALVARAWDTRRPELVAATLAWARVFLASQYRAADAPLLGRSDTLIGGFRDTVGSLDVQIDAVQHIGSALLGAEALIAGRVRPGSLP